LFRENEDGILMFELHKAKGDAAGFHGFRGWVLVPRYWQDGQEETVLASESYDLCRSRIEGTKLANGRV
jgi:hypothetical protein